jgi:hypothetical protein
MVSLIWTIRRWLSELEGNNSSRKRKKMEEPGTPDLGEGKKRGGRERKSALCLFLSSRSQNGLHTCKLVLGGFVVDDEAQA